jgi:hypothetical protein
MSVNMMAASFRWSGVSVIGQRPKYQESHTGTALFACHGGLEQTGDRGEFFGFWLLLSPSFFWIASRGLHSLFRNHFNSAASHARRSAVAMIRVEG